MWKSNPNPQICALGMTSFYKEQWTSPSSTEALPLFHIFVETVSECSPTTCQTTFFRSLLDNFHGYIKLSAALKRRPSLVAALVRHNIQFCLVKMEHPQNSFLSGWSCN